MMDIILGFVSVLLISALIGGLIYSIATKKLNLRVAIVLIAIVLVAGGLWRSWSALGTLPLSLQSPSLKTMWTMTQSYWLWILLISCIAYVLLSFIPKEKEAVAKKLQIILVLMVAMLFAVIPVLDWMTGPSEQKPPEKTALLTLSMPPGGKSTHIAVPPRIHVVVTGDKFRTHNVYQDGHECAFGEACVDGPLLYVYVTNEDPENPNVVSYEYVRM
jgi:hypothetical protein